MRIVFGSNIYVSALVFPAGKAADALRKAIQGDDDLVLSPAIIAEVLSVLASKFNRDKEALSRTAVFLSGLGTVVHPVRRISVLKDAPDNRILECAFSGKAEAIVTGDKKMLELAHYSGITIITLREYLER